MLKCAKFGALFTLIQTYIERIDREMSNSMTNAKKDLYEKKMIKIDKQEHRSKHKLPCEFV